MEYDDGFKRSVEAWYEATLNGIEANGREPTPWEAYYLVSALTSMATDSWGLAWQEIEQCRTDPDVERTLPGITIAGLRSGLATIRAR